MTKVHRVEATLFPVNAYLVELPEGVVVVDATLGMSDGRAVRARADGLRKPIVAVLVTHVHPDHYGGMTALVEGLDVPIYSVAGVADVIRRDDDAKEQILRPMFGDEWAAVRTFPDRIVAGGKRLAIGGVGFVAIDLGPGESPYDSVWCLDADGPARAFVGDLVYGRMHAYLADGFYESWLLNIERIRRELPADTRFFMGHGEPASGPSVLDWQTRYIRHFVDTLRVAVERERLDGDALADAVVSRMAGWAGTDALSFLLRLSVEPMRARLGLTA